MSNTASSTNSIENEYLALLNVLGVYNSDKTAMQAVLELQQEIKELNTTQGILVKLLNEARGEASSWERQARLA